MENIFVVRKAKIEDAPYIHEITKEVFKNYQDQVGISGYIAALNETIDDIINDIKTKEVFTAFYEGNLVGSVRIKVNEDKTAYLSRFGVNTEFQSKGVGRMLMASVDKAMEDLGVTSMSLHTASKMFSLVRFYYGQGFYIESTCKDSGYIRALLCKEYKAVGIDENYNKVV